MLYTADKAGWPNMDASIKNAASRCQMASQPSKLQVFKFRIRNKPCGFGLQGPIAAGGNFTGSGAAGGVGLTAVELGKAIAAQVIAVARGPARLEIAAAAGADHLMDPEVTDLREAAAARWRRCRL